MASVILESVTVDFPIYGYQKSFRIALRSATGGMIKREGHTDRRVIVRAIDDLSLTIHHGDRLGIVGHNGAGKSTLLRVCASVYEPTQGSVITQGKVSPLLNISPGLDLDDTAYENIITCGLFLGMTREEISRKSPEIEAFTELGDYLALPVRTYSAGMITRLGFAIATAIDPEILVLDEGLGAGDAQFAKKAKQRVDSLVARTRILILASHSESLIKSMCNRVILMQHGKIVMDGNAKEVLGEYRRVGGIGP